MTEHLKSEFVRRFIESAPATGDEIAAKTAGIYAAMLRESDDLDASKSIFFPAPNMMVCMACGTARGQG